MDRASDHGVVKILISTVEYRRLIHIEKKYLELEQKYNSQHSKTFENSAESKPSKPEDKHLNIQNQIGSGQLSNNLTNFVKVVAQFMLKENREPETPEFAQSVKHSLQSLFSEINLGAALGKKI